MHHRNKFGARTIRNLEGILSEFTIRRPTDTAGVVVLVVKAIQVLVCSVQAAKGAENYFVFHVLILLVFL